MEILVTSFLVAGCISVSIAVIGFIISLFQKRNDSADIVWGIYFVAISVFTFFFSNPAFDTRLIVLLLVVVWAFRLSSHILKRYLRTTEDARYLNWRKQWGTGVYFYVRSFLQVFLLQSILAVLIASPLIIIEQFGRDGVRLVPLILGISVWVFGFIFETIADHQLKKFLSEPENKGNIMQSGLWKYSRHPNYFGEVTQWWGIFIIGLGVPFGIFGIIGPLVITFLIIFISGIPLAEAGMSSRPEFKLYQSRTSPLVPLPLFLTRIASPKTIASILIEFGPLVLFFITFELFNFMTSVLILVVTVTVALVASLRLYGKISLFPIISSGSVIVFGLLTIFLHNPGYIIFKDTLYFGIFGLAVLIPLIFGKLSLKSMFDKIFAITDRGWKIVSLRWGVFMVLIAISNECARALLSAERWVTYKFIVLVILIIFSIWQFFLTRRERLPEGSAWGLRL